MQLQLRGPLNLICLAMRLPLIPGLSCWFLTSSLTWWVMRAFIDIVFAVTTGETTSCKGFINPLKIGCFKNIDHCISSFWWHSVWFFYICRIAVFGGPRDHIDIGKIIAICGFCCVNQELLDVRIWEAVAKKNAGVFNEIDEQFGERISVLDGKIFVVRWEDDDRIRVLDWSVCM